MSDSYGFEQEVQINIDSLAGDEDLRALSRIWLREAYGHNYTYNFTWLGRPIIQLPQDMLAMQELIWRVQPELVIETGIAHGGGLIYYASLLELIGGRGLALGIDIDIRQQNRVAIENHPMSKRILMIQGSSVDDAVIGQVRSIAQDRRPVLVVLDSSHTHDHVLRELELYSPFVEEGSYIVVFDTDIEEMPAGFYRDRPWDKGNNPETAVREFVNRNGRFAIDQRMPSKLLVTCARHGYLKCVKDAR